MAARGFLLGIQSLPLFLTHRLFEVYGVHATPCRLAKGTLAHATTQCKLCSACDLQTGTPLDHPMVQNQRCCVAHILVNVLPCSFVLREQQAG